jgi:hypothetical protein
MAITAGAASDKIHELRSKLAVNATFAELVRNNYMPCDAGAPESVITREDGGAVTEKHLGAVLEDLEHQAAELREELGQWEGLVFEPKAAEVRSIRPAPVAAPEPEPEAVEEHQPKKERTRIGGRRIQQQHAPK